MAYMKTIKKRTNTVPGGLTTSAARAEKFASKNAGKKLKVVATPITGSKIAKPLTKSIGSKLTTASAREEKFASNKKLAMNKVAKKR